jgi:hypothetical protein
MAAIRMRRATPGKSGSSQNGLPEQVPYVWGEQTRRNTYAGRIAQRNVDGWWLLPAAVRAELTRPAFATRTTRGARPAPTRRSPGI